MKNLRMVLLVMIFLVLGCATGTMVRTDPPQADVYIKKNDYRVDSSFILQYAKEIQK